MKTSRNTPRVCDTFTVIDYFGDIRSYRVTGFLKPAPPAAAEPGPAG